MRHGLLLALALLANGCAVRDGERTHHVILGFGIVTVTHTNENVAKVVHTRALGLTASEDGVVLGLTSTVTTRINTNQNVLIELSPTHIRIP